MYEYVHSYNARASQCRVETQSRKMYLQLIFIITSLLRERRVATSALLLYSRRAVRYYCASPVLRVHSGFTHNEYHQRIA